MFPTGTVTFLFTDIEGSTQLWERHPITMKAALARHDAILREAIEGNSGHIIKTTGDGVHAVFEAAHDAVKGVVTAQHDLIAEPWGETGPLRVRMALHTAEAELRDGDYYGPALNRAARLMSVGWGGQVLLSASAAELVKETVALRDLGEHRLKDLVRPESVYQLIAPGLPADFPALKSLSVIPNNLPMQLTTFVGREKEMAEVNALITGARLVTLIGPGGTGKTRLSLQVSTNLLESFADGVWLVEFAPLADPALVVHALASVFQVRDVPGQSLLDILTDYLRNKNVLLIFDNCEHLVETTVQLADTLLHACPKLKIIASSREALGISGERLYRVPSLTLPESDKPSADSLQRCESAQLFLDRALAANSRFALVNANAPAVSQICRRLDGIPLALELAAARVKVFSAEQIAARLDDRFRLLTGGSRTALPRQQTLRALIDWSYDLLPEAERVALRQLSVFAGGWTFEAAEAVIGPDALDLLSNLVDRSLVVVEEQPTAVRYRLLETIRQYARDKLFEANEAAEARNRHLAYFCSLSSYEEPRIVGPEMIDSLNSLKAELDNIRAAIEWANETQPLMALELVGNLNVLWRRRINITEGLQLGQAALLRAEAVAPDRGEARRKFLILKAKALHAIAFLYFENSNNVDAVQTIAQGIAVAREADDVKVLTQLLSLGGMSAGLLGQIEKAYAFAAEAIEISRRENYPYELSMALSAMGMLSFFARDPNAHLYSDEIFQLAHKIKDPWLIALAAQNAARLDSARGEWAKARTGYEEAIAQFLYMGDKRFYQANRSDLAHMLRQSGQLEEAHAIYRTTLAAWHEVGNRSATAHELECFGFLALKYNQLQRAATLLGAAEHLREECRSPMAPYERGEYDAAISELREQISDVDFNSTWQAGRGFTVEQAVAFALEA